MLNALKTLAAALLMGAAIATSAVAQDPYEEPDDTWITLTGEVVAVLPNAFTLDYGDGMVTVEMDDFDRDADAYALLEGDSVTVTGVVDDDFFEATTIEASTVLVHKLNTFFYASAADEEDLPLVTYHVTPMLDGDVVIEGTVTDVDIEEFTLAAGLTVIRVEVDDMPYNPLDSEGYQRIEVGDVVSVSGHIDYDFLEGRELVAETVVEIRD